MIQEPALLGLALMIYAMSPLHREGVGEAEHVIGLLIIIPKDTYLFKIISLFKLAL